jgi:hypothetical protein
VVSKVSSSADILVQPPTPNAPQGYTLDNPPAITHSAASTSPRNSTPAGTDDDDAVETITRDFAEKGSIHEKSGRRLGSRKGLAKHLHVPGVKGMGKGRPSSVRRMQEGTESGESQDALPAAIADGIRPDEPRSHSLKFEYCLISRSYRYTLTLPRCWLDLRVTTSGATSRYRSTYARAHCRRISYALQPMAHVRCHLPPLGQNGAVPRGHQ